MQLNAHHDHKDWTVRQERGTYRTLRLIVVLSLRIGRRASRFLIYCLAAYFCLFSPHERAALQRFYHNLEGKKANWRRLYRHFLSFATVLHDRVFLLNGQTKLFTLETCGEQNLHALAQQSQRGALIAGAHLGSFEMLKAFGERHGQTVTMLMYEENSHQINATLAAINPHVRMPIIALNRLDSMLKAREHIEQGAWLGMLADRSFGADSKQAFPFLGQPALFSNGPWRLAALLNCPVFFMAAFWQGGARYRIEIVPLADFSNYAAQTRGQRAQTILTAQQHYVDLLQDMVRRYPDNWFNFHDFWQEAHHET